jgi:uncharacterized repeat protein (TIGR03803 family)
MTSVANGRFDAYRNATRHTSSALRKLSLAAFFAAGILPHTGTGAHAASFVSLYDFKGGNDGAAPYGALVADKNGVLYGTTAFGGKFGSGTVFSLTHASGNMWTHKVIYNFTGGSDGAYPMAGVIVDPANGALYGTASSGGLSNSNCSGCGTVFKLAPNAKKTGWVIKVIYSFKGGNKDGSLPLARLLMDSKGVFYGTASTGGPKRFGAVFGLTPKSKGAYAYAILHFFSGGADGGTPNAGLIFDTVGGALLGTTSKEGTKSGQCSQDGRGCGTFFRLTKSGNKWSQSFIYRFKGKKDGMEPSGPLVFIGKNLYGTTRLGGTGGQGSVFTIMPGNASHTAWTEQLLYSFKAGTDGKGPMGVIAHTNNHLFGLTESGGNAGGPVHGGTLFELIPSKKGNSWTEVVRHRFTGGADGADPQGTLLLDAGVLYGTGNDGGNGSDSGSFFKYLP